MCRSDESRRPAEDEATVPASTAASWQSAETQLFGALVSRPDAYRGVIEMVGATVDRLRALGPSSAALRDAAPTIGALVRDVPEQDVLSADGIDPDLVGRAALALRYREVVAEQASLRRVELLSAARAGQLAWLVLEETGEPAGDPCFPYRRLEAEAATGRALLVTTTPDDDFRTCQHRVEAVHIDLGTGRIEHPGGTGENPIRCPNATDREERVKTLREASTRSG